NRDAGRHGAEQGQEKAGERIDSQMERQVRQTQREHYLRGRQPYRLQAEGRQGEARYRAGGKRKPAREQRVTGGYQTGNPHRKPGYGDGKGACEWGKNQGPGGPQRAARFLAARAAARSSAAGAPA